MRPVPTSLAKRSSDGDVGSIPLVVVLNTQYQMNSAQRAERVQRPNGSGARVEQLFRAVDQQKSRAHNLCCDIVSGSL
jgi:hypothetical protein